MRLSGPEAVPRWLSTPRAHAQHKGTFGDVLVIGGAMGMVGAAVLAARAALAAGAGRVYLGLLAAQDTLPFDAAQPELMARPSAQLLEPDVLRSRPWCAAAAAATPYAPPCPQSAPCTPPGARRRRAECDRS